jgi:hypothetical protein
METVIVTDKEKTFIGKAYTCHKVGKGKGEKIADILNKLNYRLTEGEKWTVWFIGNSLAKDFAEIQAFTIGKRGIREVLK